MSEMRPMVWIILAITLLITVAPTWANFQDGTTAYLMGNWKTAEKEFLPLAEKGNAEAQYFLGNMYGQGDHGLQQDQSKAYHWYHRAAEQGHKKAQENLSRIYAEGIGVPQDLIKAYMWASLAAKAETSIPRQAILEAYRDTIPWTWDEERPGEKKRRMTDSQIVEAKRRAQAWKPKLGLKGSTR